MVINMQNTASFVSGKKTLLAMFG